MNANRIQILRARFEKINAIKPEHQIGLDAILQDAAENTLNQFVAEKIRWLSDAAQRELDRRHKPDPLAEWWKKRDAAEAEEKCRCGNPAAELHPCPSEEELHDNHEPICRCCDACVQRCCEEI